MWESSTLDDSSEVDLTGPRSSQKKRRQATLLSTFLLVGILVFAASCVPPNENSTALEKGKAPENDGALEGARFDHVVIFAEDDALQSWLEVHLTPAEALETRHDGQGTRGRYFLFLNSFLEVLTLEDADEAQSNEEAFGSPYVARWRDEHAAPIAFGLTLEKDSFASPPFDHLRYRQEDDGGGYVMAKGNVDLSAPLVYATGPDRAYPRRESIKELDSIEDAGRREEVRRYLTHSCGAKSLTQVIWRAPESGNRGPNTELMHSFPEVTLEQGIHHEIILEFDNAASGREVRFDGRPSVMLRF